MTQPQPFASIRYFFNALGPGFAPALSGLSRLVTDGAGTIWAQWRLVPHLRLQLLEEVLGHDYFAATYPFDRINSWNGG